MIFRFKSALTHTAKGGSAVRAANGRPYVLKEKNILYKT